MSEAGGCKKNYEVRSDVATAALGGGGLEGGSGRECREDKW